MNQRLKEIVLQATTDKIIDFDSLVINSGDLSFLELVILLINIYKQNIAIRRDIFDVKKEYFNYEKLNYDENAIEILSSYKSELFDEIDNKMFKNIKLSRKIVRYCIEYSMYYTDFTNLLSEVILKISSILENELKKLSFETEEIKEFVYDNVIIYTILKHQKEELDSIYEKYLLQIKISKKYYHHKKHNEDGSICEHDEFTCEENIHNLERYLDDDYIIDENLIDEFSENLSKIYSISLRTPKLNYIEQIIILNYLGLSDVKEDILENELLDKALYKLSHYCIDPFIYNLDYIEGEKTQDISSISQLLGGAK